MADKNEASPGQEKSHALAPAPEQPPWVHVLRQYQGLGYQFLARAPSILTNDEEGKEKIRHVGSTLERLVRHHATQEGFSIFNPKTWSFLNFGKLLRDTAIAYVLTDNRKTKNILKPLATLYEKHQSGEPLPFEDVVELACKIPNPRSQPLAATNALLVLADSRGYLSIEGASKAQRGEILTRVLEFLPHAREHSFSSEQIKERTRVIISKATAASVQEISLSDQVDFSTNAENNASAHYTVRINDEYVLSVTAITDKGVKRTANEDNYSLHGTFLTVADGMGGHSAGEVASALVCETIPQERKDVIPTETYLLPLLKKANEKIEEKITEDSDKRGMGATGVVVDFRSDNILSFTSVGDCRLYVHTPEKAAGIVPGASLEQLTQDHSVIWENLFVWEKYSAGDSVLKEQARLSSTKSQVTNCIGGPSGLSVDRTIQINRPFIAGERYLLCSDGLWDEISDADIENILALAPDNNTALQWIVDRAKENGGSDNITAVLAEVIYAPIKQAAGTYTEAEVDARIKTEQERAAAAYKTISQITRDNLATTSQQLDEKTRENARLSGRIKALREYKEIPRTESGARLYTQKEYDDAIKSAGEDALLRYVEKIRADAISVPSVPQGLSVLERKEIENAIERKYAGFIPPADHQAALQKKDQDAEERIETELAQVRQSHEEQIADYERRLKEGEASTALTPTGMYTQEQYDRALAEKDEKIRILQATTAVGAVGTAIGAAAHIFDKTKYTEEDLTKAREEERKNLLASGDYVTTAEAERRVHEARDEIVRQNDVDNQNIIMRYGQEVAGYNTIINKLKENLALEQEKLIAALGRIDSLESITDTFATETTYPKIKPKSYTQEDLDGEYQRGLQKGIAEGRRTPEQDVPPERPLPIDPKYSHPARPRQDVVQPTKEKSYAHLFPLKTKK